MLANTCTNFDVKSGLSVHFLKAIYTKIGNFTRHIDTDVNADSDANPKSIAATNFSSQVHKTRKVGFFAYRYQCEYPYADIQYLRNGTKRNGKKRNSFELMYMLQKVK